MQRLRLKFGRGEEVKYISHLDVVRFWERVFRRAGIHLAYSKGFTAHPRISVAAPLAVGVTSEAELMDVWLSRWMPPQSFVMSVKSQLPRGFNVFDAWEVGLNIPSLQSSLAFAEYCVRVSIEKSEPQVEASFHALLQVKELPWHHSRDSKIHYYDLRALIDDLWIVSYHDSLCVLGMRLRCDANGSGRPEQVATALGFSLYPESIHRTKLILKGTSFCPHEPKP
jgi:radical SAM-linked protein